MIAKIRKLPPRSRPFWAVAACWDTYPFRIVWVGFWEIAYDRSGCYYRRWPHIKILWNDD